VRIAIATWSRRKAGGIETYLGNTIAGLHAADHDLAFWSELDQPADRERITLPASVPAWCVSDLGAECALTALREWHPDVIYSHGLLDPDLEARLLAIAPAVFFAHAYYGTCISGTKTFKFPVIAPCSRQFGWQCLMHFYPHRCGGWSPFTMARDYRRQSKRLKLLRRYKAILTFSGHMAREYVKHGFPADRIHVLSSIQNGHASNGAHQIAKTGLGSMHREIPAVNQSPLTDSRSRPFWRLLFLGRMDLLKGGRILLDALPQVAASLDRPLRVTFAGDGPDRNAWERLAARAKSQNHGLEIEFLGWLEGQRREALLADSDLLVMPSQWPEPFGLSGLEASARGVPSVAFAVGGIPEWLSDGVNGFLAPGNPPTAAGLSDAIVRALHDPQTHARLRQGALERAQEHTLQGHLLQLLPVLERYAR
jgi:glycosyltransferase involved in cell wall biosynthesis